MMLAFLVMALWCAVLLGGSVHLARSCADDIRSDR
jgi:hypothetical protein